MQSALRLLFTYIGVTAALSTQLTHNITTPASPTNDVHTPVSPLQLTDSHHSTIDLKPAIYGFRIDTNKAEYHPEKIVIPPDKVTMTVYGQRVDKLDKIEIRHGSCANDEKKIGASIASGDYLRQLQTRIVFSHSFELGSYVVCARDSSGALVKIEDNRSIVVRITPSEERTFKLHFLWLQIVVIVLLHVLSAFFSGLSLGLMTLTVRELEIIAKSGSEKEQDYANRILPLRRKGNQLLCTLLLGNTLCNASISILLDELLVPVISNYSIMVATVTLLLFGEILPQSICVNNALATGARMMMFAKICMYLFSLFAWPISKVLDWFVGEEHESYDRKRLMELMNRVIANNPDVNDELQIAAGAMNLKRKIVQESMTPIEEVFMLPETANLNSSAIAAIVRAGYTRIPVFRAGNKKDICDVLITKDLALIDPDDNYTVRMLCNIYKHPIPRMRHDVTLFVALQIFRKGEDGHLALVYEHDETNTIGIISLEDVVEEILQEEIKDEFDLKREKRGHEKILWDTTAPPAVMGKQLQTVCYQFCVANEEAFKDRYLERNIFQRLMTSCTKNVDVNYLKPLGGALTVPIKQLPRCARLYTKDEMSDRYILILEGRAEVTIGQGGMKFEAGPFHRFGQELLQKLIQYADELCKRPAESAVDAKQLMQFKPDFSVAVFEDCTFLEVTASMYIKALRMTKLQRETKNTAAIYADFKSKGALDSPDSRRPLMPLSEKMPLSQPKSSSKEQTLPSREEIKKPAGPAPVTPLNTAASASRTVSTESGRVTDETK